MKKISTEVYVVKQLEQWEDSYIVFVTDDECKAQTYCDEMNIVDDRCTYAVYPYVLQNPPPIAMYVVFDAITGERLKSTADCYEYPDIEREDDEEEDTKYKCCYVTGANLKEALKNSEIRIKKYLEGERGKTC